MNAAVLKSKRGYELHSPSFERIYLFYENDGKIHSYRFINTNERADGQNYKYLVQKDGDAIIHMTLARFDYCYRRRLFAIEKLNAPNMANNRHFANERKYTQEELDELMDDINDIEF